MESVTKGRQRRRGRKGRWEGGEEEGLHEWDGRIRVRKMDVSKVSKEGSERRKMIRRDGRETRKAANKKR